MKTLTQLIISAFILCPFFANGQDTLNVNGGFEAADSSLGWIYQANSGKASYEIVSNDKHSGNKSVYIKVEKVATQYWEIQMDFGT